MDAVHDPVTQMSLFSAVVETDSQLGFSVRESSRAKRLSIKVFPRGRVEVVVPKRTRPIDVQAFVEANREWIQGARSQFAAEHKPEPFALPVVIHLDGIGRRVSVSYEPQVGAKTVRFRCSNRRLLLYGKTADDALCVDALKRWLTSVARKEYLPQLHSLAAMTNASFGKMHVRGQRSCWGSHSSSGTISLNYCLMFLEPAQLRYVMIHELCHATYMNHSQRFWRLVGRFEPDYQQLDRDLNGSWKKIPTWVGLY